jgi:hypothetical protein
LVTFADRGAIVLIEKRLQYAPIPIAAIAIKATMAAKTMPSKVNINSARPSTLAMVVVGTLWVALLSGSAEASGNFNRNAFVNGIERNLKSSKGSSSKASKAKSCKSSKKYKNDYGYYDHCFEEVEIDIPDGNATNATNATIEVIDEEDSESYSKSYSKSYKSKDSKKGSKSGYYSTSVEDEDEDEEDSESYSKTYKSKGSKGSKSGYYSKSDKKSKSKSDKSCKDSKKSKSGCDDSDDDGPIDSGFTPSVSWEVFFPDAVETGFLFYDKVTKFAWYAYTAQTGAQEVVSVSTTAAVATVKTEVVKGSSSTIGKICPLDVTNEGSVKSELCVDIKTAARWKNATSTKIIAAEVCRSTVNDSVMKMAVVVEDTSKVLHLDPNLVGSRMLVYDIVIGSKAGGDAIIAELAYEGWKSLYGEPGINGQPAFTPDCKKVFASWLSPMDSDEDSIDLVDSTTIATNIESVVKAGDSAEIWRLGTSGRLAGLTATKDGKSVISAANVPKEDKLNIGGIVKLSASNGQVEDQFVWPANSLKLPHNAFTNPVLDDNGYAYYIDSVLGLVKFEGDDLDDGPVWSAVGGYYRTEDFLVKEAEEEKTEAAEKAEVKLVTAQTKQMVPVVPVEEMNVRRFRMLMEEDEVTFTAFQPALDESDFATVYGCGMTRRGDERDGVIAVSANNGDSVWHKKFLDHAAVNVGSCRGIS